MIAEVVDCYTSCQWYWFALLIGVVILTTIAELRK